MYVAWKEDDSQFCMRRVGAFGVAIPEHFVELRNKIRNILDWGKGTRLKQVRDALDVIGEEHRKKTSAQAKSRPPPSDGSVGSVTKRARSVSSRTGGKTRTGSSLRNEISQLYKTPNSSSAVEGSVWASIEASAGASGGPPTLNVDQTLAQTTIPANSTLTNSNLAWGLYPTPAMPPSPSQSAQLIQNPYQLAQPPYGAAGGQYYLPNTPDGGYSQYVPNGQDQTQPHAADEQKWQI